MKIKFLTCIILVFLSGNIVAQEEVYELRTYELGFFKSADILHNYLKLALIPALNRQGIDNVGAFEEYGEGLPKKIYLLIAYKDIQAFSLIKDALVMDNQYLEEATAYLKGGETSMPFDRISTELIKSTSGFPMLVKPAADNIFFELRTYYSHNEDALRRKVKMFNDGEFPIFEDVGLSMVFFGSNIAGGQMPCLTYLLATEDKAANTEGWSKFIAHPEWQRLSKLEEYANSMNEITRVFLRPLPYSQL